MWYSANNKYFSTKILSRVSYDLLTGEEIVSGLQLDSPPDPGYVPDPEEIPA